MFSASSVRLYNSAFNYNTYSSSRSPPTSVVQTSLQLQEIDADSLILHVASMIASVIVFRSSNDFALNTRLSEDAIAFSSSSSMSCVMPEYENASVNKLKPAHKAAQSPCLVEANIRRITIIIDINVVFHKVKRT